MGAGQGQSVDNGVSPAFGYGFATLQDPVWTLDHVLAATGGKCVAGRPEVRFRAVSTDSRTIEPGDLFVALAGDNFDAHDYLTAAVARGAAGLVVERLEQDFSGAAIVQVDDCLRALGELARYRRRQIAGLRVIAITGSSGKTTVKEMCASIMAEQGPVLKTMGNFNNLVGLPLSLLPVDYRHQTAVLEMGMNRPGEIARMTEIAEPDICCVLNVQAAHLAGLKSVAGVARAKGELLAGSRKEAVFCINGDDELIRELASHFDQRQIIYGFGRGAMVRATHVRNCGSKGMAFTLHIGDEKRRLQLACLGEHNVVNGLAAAALAHGAGADIDQIGRGLESFRPFAQRLQLVEVAGLMVVNDCYNANPASMEAAFATVSALRQHRSVAVLGDMLEMGDDDEAVHFKLGEVVAGAGFDYLLVYGSRADFIAQGALAAGMDKKRIKWPASRLAAAEILHSLAVRGELGSTDPVLIKGSRGMGMEKIITYLKTVNSE